MKTRRFLSLLLCAVIIITLAPTAAFALDMQGGAPTLTVNTSVICFAGQEWRVIGYNGSGIYSQAGTATLLLKSDSNPYGNTIFDPFGSVNRYGDSTLQLRMEELAADINLFPEKEQELINPRTLTASDDINFPIMGGDVANQKLWPLSADEWIAIGNDTVRSFGSSYWLRSRASDDAAWFGSSTGSTSGGTFAKDAYAARPALNLSLSSVLFTSAASGVNAKADATVGSGLVGTQAPTGAIKFTVQDSGQTLNVIATTAQSTQANQSTLQLSYDNATIGTNQYVSCVLVDGTEVKYFGKLADSSSAASGTLSIPLTGVTDGTYTLKVFSEEANGNNYTDFCSTPVEMTVTVSGGTCTVSSFGGTVLSDNAALSTVAGQVITAGSEAGTVGAPKTASVNVVSSVSSVALSDIVPTDTNATVAQYSESGYSLNKDAAVSLAAGGATHVYVKVIAEDGTSLYYDVTVNRAAPTYTLTVQNGTGGGSYTAGAQVPIQADAAPSGKVFDEWTTSGGGTFADAACASTTFAMPGNAVTVMATYKDALAPTYSLTVQNGTGSGSYTAGTQVPIQADSAPSGKVFDKWTTNGGGTFANADSVSTTFAMPDNAVTVTATYKDAVITGLPTTSTMYESGRVTWNPQPEGGTWEWDHDFFSATFNSPATFTALKTGTSTITYTVNGMSQSITVTIRESELPSTGQDFTWAGVIGVLAVVCGAVALFRFRVKDQRVR